MPQKALPGAPREAQMHPRSPPGGPRRGPREPKTAPRAARSAPRGHQEAPQRTKKGPKKATLSQIGSGRPPGADLGASGVDFGASGGAFWRIFGAIFRQVCSQRSLLLPFGCLRVLLERCRLSLLPCSWCSCGAWCLRRFFQLKTLRGRAERGREATCERRGLRSDT